MCLDLIWHQKSFHTQKTYDVTFQKIIDKEIFYTHITFEKPPSCWAPMWVCKTLLGLTLTVHNLVKIIIFFHRICLRLQVQLSRTGPSGWQIHCPILCAEQVIESSAELYWVHGWPDGSAILFSRCFQRHLEQIHQQAGWTSFEQTFSHS